MCVDTIPISNNHTQPQPSQLVGYNCIQELKFRKNFRWFFEENVSKIVWRVTIPWVLLRIQWAHYMGKLSCDIVQNAHILLLLHLVLFSTGPNQKICNLTFVLCYRHTYPIAVNNVCTTIEQSSKEKPFSVTFSTEAVYSMMGNCREGISYRSMLH